MEKRGKEALIDVGFLSPQLFLPSVFSQDRKSDTKMFLLPEVDSVDERGRDGEDMAKVGRTLAVGEAR